MHDDRQLVEHRIRRETFQRVLPAMYRAVQPFTVEAWDVPGEPVPFAAAMGALAAGEFRPFTVGDHWSRPWGTTWFRLTADVPPGWDTAELEAVIDLGFHPDSAGFQSEGLVYLDGAPLQGVHPRRTGVPLARRRGPLELLVEAASNPAVPGFAPTPMGDPATAGDRALYRLRRAELAQRDDEVFHLLLDIEVLDGLMHALPRNEQRRQRLLRTLEAALDALDDADIGGTAARAREMLRPALQAGARASAHRTIAVGHAHIDSAWLWPVRETMRKCARTFASAVRLMDDYPEYRFVCSQAAQYDWIEHQQPAIFERIKAKVDAGQWQPIGGMWVEADMNLPSGESLVRQLVHGQRYFDSRFGVRCAEVWIPDVFGYPASLPQIFAAAGCSRFVTQKLSWNKQNVFPHSTFWWEGIDGTRVLTHFPPVDTYNAEITPAEMVFAEHNFKDHGWSDWSLVPFGYGNGGGGPTREMIERARRMADLDGAPTISLGTTDQFFAHVEAEAAGAPVWRGELYLEVHRGTLTSQIETKVGNRRCERLLREAELWWAALGEQPPGIDELWKEVLLQQFHDILPGSSIAWVHDDAEAAHERIAAQLEELVGEALARLAIGRCVANASTHDRAEVVVVDGEPVFVAVPGSGLATLVPAPLDDQVTVTEHSMSNGRLAVSWNLEGEITSVIDVAEARQLLPPGGRIALVLAADHPVEYDAWDVEAWSIAAARPLDGEATVELLDDGPLMATLRVCRTFGRSAVTQTVRLRAGSARLDIEHDIDWQEDEQLLALDVPLDLRADTAACDIQFGQVHRPTHPSSPWDAAKFEVCAHRFVDLREGDFGVAVLNDGRYGHSLFHGGVRVSLLRAARYPDPDADRGHHQVTIALLPHGPGREHEVLHEAEALNVPLRVVTTGTASALPAPLVTVDSPDVQLSAVKLADDGSTDLVVRLYEASGRRARAALRLPGRTIDVAARADLLETPSAAIEVTDGLVELVLRPYEIVTLRLKLV